VADFGTLERHRERYREGRRYRRNTRSDAEKRAIRILLGEIPQSRGWISLSVEGCLSLFNDHEDHDAAKN